MFWAPQRAATVVGQPNHSLQADVLVCFCFCIFSCDFACSSGPIGVTAVLARCTGPRLQSPSGRPTARDAPNHAQCPYTLNTCEPPQSYHTSTGVVTWAPAPCRPCTGASTPPCELPRPRWTVASLPLPLPMPAAHAVSQGTRGLAEAVQCTLGPLTAFELRAGGGKPPAPFSPHGSGRLPHASASC